jgi:hypothetical protein
MRKFFLETIPSFTSLNSRVMTNTILFVYLDPALLLNPQSDPGYGYTHQDSGHGSGFKPRFESGHEYGFNPRFGVTAKNRKRLK